ncbi:MAG TPA: hypothetical protein DCS28_00305 [Candidatus Moranbacteria bacterium]|nr:hypothetical protein [Candidatus Moranbacteria bacterium]HAT74475.1 hypothetical protein [Candidatus Moranbacteria bacterium]
MDRMEQKISPPVKNTAETKQEDINKKPIGELLRRNFDMADLSEENRKTLKLFSEIEEIKTALYAQFFSNKKRDFDHHLSFISFDDLNKSNKKDLDSVAGFLRELIFLENSERSVDENEITEATEQHELAMGDILNKITDRKSYFAQYLGNTAQYVRYFGEIITKSRQKTE